MMVLVDYGERLKVFRRALRLSQDALATAIGMTQPVFGRAERGEHYLGMDKLIRLHDRYSLNINWLLVGTGTMLVDKGNCGRAVQVMAWDADQVPDDAALSDEVSERLREEMWHSQTDLDPDQYIVLRFLLERMAVGLGRPPSSLFIRKLLFIARGPNPRDSRITGRPKVAEEPPKNAL